jgi:hypothetical protein
VLCGLFYLLAVLAYLRVVAAAPAGAHDAATAGAGAGGGISADARADGRMGWWLASLAAFAAALASKAIAMTLPLSLLVLDLYPLGRRRLGWRGLVVEKLPYAVLGVAAASVAMTTRQESGNITSYEQYGPAARVALAGYALWFYPAHLVWPAGLSPIYELPLRMDLAQWRFLGPTLAFAAVTAALLWLRRRWPGGLAAWAHSAIVLAPVSGVVHSGSQLAHDRYSYLSGLGFAVLAGGGVAWMLARGPARGAAWLPRAGAGVAAAVVAALAVATWAQASVHPHKPMTPRSGSPAWVHTHACSVQHEGR